MFLDGRIYGVPFTVDPPSSSKNMRRRSCLGKGKKRERERREEEGGCEKGMHGVESDEQSVLSHANPAGRLRS